MRRQFINDIIQVERVLDLLEHSSHAVIRIRHSLVPLASWKRCLDTSDESENQEDVLNQEKETLMAMVQLDPRDSRMSKVHPDLRDLWNETVKTGLHKIDEELLIHIRNAASAPNKSLSRKETKAALTAADAILKSLDELKRELEVRCNAIVVDEEGSLTETSFNREKTEPDSKDEKQANSFSIQWLILSLIFGLGAAALTFAISVTEGIWRASITVGIIVALTSALKNPKTRYMRFATFMGWAWFSSMILPTLNLDVSGPAFLMNLVTEGPPTAFHISSAVLIAVALILDWKERQ